MPNSKGDYLKLFWCMEVVWLVLAGFILSVNSSGKSGTAISGATNMDLSMTARLVLAKMPSHRIKTMTIRDGK